MRTPVYLLFILLLVMPTASQGQVVTSGGGGSGQPHDGEATTPSDSTAKTDGQAETRRTPQEIHDKLVRNISVSWRKCHPLQIGKKFQDIMDVYNHMLIEKIPELNNVSVNVEDPNGCLIKKKAAHKCYFRRKGHEELKAFLAHPDTAEFMKTKFGLTDQKAQEVLKFYKELLTWKK